MLSDKAASFRSMCLEDPAGQCPERPEWLDLKPGRQLELVERFLEAAERGDARLEMVPYPELQHFFKAAWEPYVSRGLLGLIEAGIKLNPAACRKGYAHDLGAMSRLCHGPESPAGWLPFVCLIGHRPHALITGMWCRGDGKDRIAFCMLAEVLQS